MRPFLLLITFALSLIAPAQAKTHRAVRHHTTSHSRPAKRTVKAPADQGVKVWVNTNSGVYHFPGQRWYGNTAEGEYLSESAAKKAGYRPTQNGQ